MILLISMIILYFIGKIIYNTYEIDVKYDSRIMSCKIDNSNLIYEIKGLSVLNTNFIDYITNDETLIFIHNTINLYNKRISHFEYHESMSRLLNEEKVIFYSLDINKDLSVKNDIIKVYYTEETLKNIKNNDEEQLKKILKKS